MSSVALTIAGGVAQIAGFLLAAYEISRTQRREFPDDVPVHHRLARFLVRLFGRRRDAQVKSVTAHATLSAGGDLTAEVSRSPEVTLDGRVACLEAEVQDLRREQREGHERLHTRLTEVNQRLTDAESGLRKELNELEADRKQSLRESLFFQRVGVVLFVVGVALGVLGSTL